MCYYLRTYHKFECGHEVLFRRQYLDCNGYNCRASRFHNPNEHMCYGNPGCTDIMPDDQRLVIVQPLEFCNPCRGIPEHPTNGVNGHSESESEGGGSEGNGDNAE
ncbi:hypothetical protein IEO21_04958 [Rhodonia placenta]|uniref:Uncharacterized protein n=1 Tax=Rhodonia placenta TaxID=104341 RepID=A0A8H7P2T7_9APHY|nr:hypothetical protein IEO21_04958 [Postia placenta]